jgi:hypothetical protein
VQALVLRVQDDQRVLRRGRDPGAAEERGRRPQAGIERFTEAESLRLGPDRVAVIGRRSFQQEELAVLRQHREIGSPVAAEVAGDDRSRGGRKRDPLRDRRRRSLFLHLCERGKPAIASTEDQQLAARRHRDVHLVAAVELPQSERGRGRGQGDDLRLGVQRSRRPLEDVDLRPVRPVDPHHDVRQPVRSIDLAGDERRHRPGERRRLAPWEASPAVSEDPAKLGAAGGRGHDVEVSVAVEVARAQQIDRPRQLEPACWRLERGHARGAVRREPPRGRAQDAGFRSASVQHDGGPRS